MRPVLRGLGIAAFWGAWPFWYFYFRANNRRSRVLVVAGDEFLLLRDWIGRGRWGLPGGGADKDESMAASAVRELYEEARIETAESALRYLGKRRNKHAGLKYNAEYFVLELVQKPVVKPLWHEISDARWVTVQDVRSMSVNEDVTYVLKKYRPLGQTELL